MLRDEVVWKLTYGHPELAEDCTFWCQAWGIIERYGSRAHGTGRTKTVLLRHGGVDFAEDVDHFWVDAKKNWHDPPVGTWILFKSRAVIKKDPHGTDGHTFYLKNGKLLMSDPYTGKPAAREKTFKKYKIADWERAIRASRNQQAYERNQERRSVERWQRMLGGPLFDE